MNCVLLSKILACVVIFQTCIPLALPGKVCTYLPVNSTEEVSVSNVTSPSGSHQYVWNKTSISARDYQQSFCPRRCQNEELVFLHDVEEHCPQLNCFPCECSRPKCEIYGICCPDVTEPNQPPPGLKHFHTPNPPPPNGGALTTILPSSASSGSGPGLGCDSVSSDEGPFLYINSCPSGYSGDEQTVKLCEDVSRENATLEIHTRSVDTATGAIYRNRHCAVCNNATEPLQMSIKIECKTFMNLYASQELEELFQRAMKDQNCRVEQIIPDGAIKLACEDKSFSNVIDSCSDTEVEMYYDKEVVQACADLKDYTHTVHSAFTGKYFKNIFCAVCNMDMYPGYGGSCQCEETLPSPLDPLPFTMLLTFIKHDTPGPPPNIFTLSNCSDTEWSSPDGRCMALKCVPGKRPENESCVATFPQIVGLSYTIRLWLLSDVDKVHRVPDDLDINLFLRILLAKLKFYLETVATYYVIKCGSLEDTRRNTDTDSGEKTSYLYWSEITMVGDMTLSRDIVEQRLSETFVKQRIHVDVNATRDVTLTPYVLLGDFDFTTDCNQTSPNSVCSVVTDSYSQNKMLLKPNTFIEYTTTLGCRFVSFNESQYGIRTSTFPFNITVTVNLGGVTLNFSQASDLNMMAVTQDGFLNVCKRVLDQKLTKVNTSSESPPVNNPLYVVTMASLGASMLGLVLTLITYCRFPVLRNMAGMHNVFLSATLLCAQVLLVASSHVKPPSTFCTILGITTHFVWLLKFMWTFICSFQMLRVFTAKTRTPVSTGRKRRVRLLKLSLGSMVLPILVIAGVIAYSELSSHGEEMGYGVRLCYLDREYVVGVAFAGPALLVSACNIVCFCVTVAAINKIRRLQKSNVINKDAYRNLHVYVKLSTMTGAFWAVSILAENLDINVLRFIAVIINGLQGVFIFLSFVCNKRVLYYYLPSLSSSDVSTSRPKTALDLAHRDTSTF